MSETVATVLWDMGEVLVLGGLIVWVVYRVIRFAWFAFEELTS